MKTKTSLGYKIKENIIKYKGLFESKKRNSFAFVLCCGLFPLWFVLIPDIFEKNGLGLDFWKYIYDKFVMVLIGYGILLLLFLLFTVLFRKIAISALVLGNISAIAGWTHYYKTLYRSEPLLPSDTFMMFDAMKVADTKLNITPTPIMIVTVVLILIAGACVWFVRLPNFMLEGKRLKKLLINCLSVLLIVAVLTASFAFVLFNDAVLGKLGYVESNGLAEFYASNTFFASYFAMTKYVFPQTPQGYDEAAMAAVSSQLGNIDPKRDKTPDILIVVDESWFELANYNAEFSPDIMANYKRLSEEGISGYMVSSKYGGGTADVEYELLTGFASGASLGSTTAFNILTYPEFPGIPGYLKTKDYGTYSLHAYTDELYNRKNAYPHLGIDESYFSDSFDDPELFGEWISDAACIDKLIEIYEKGISEHEHVFIHTLTMQNHIPYYGFDIERDVKVKSSETSQVYWDIVPYVAASMHKTDQAIGRLTNYLRGLDRDVILIVVGDHQTSLISEDGIDVLDETGFYESYEEQRDFLKLHTTPYLIWTNFDHDYDGTTFGNVPPNMLLPRALYIYDIARPVYFDYLLQNTKTMNGMSSNFVVNIDGSVSFEKSAAQRKEEAARELLQYDIIYGKKYTKDFLY